MGLSKNDINASVALLGEIDSLAREKLLSESDVFMAFEHALQKAYAETYGASNDIRVTIHRKTGEISVHRHRKVVEGDIETCPFKEITLSKAQKIQKGIELHDDLVEELPLIHFSRVMVQNIKQNLMQNIQMLERDSRYAEFKDRVGQIISGTVKSVSERIREDSFRGRRGERHKSDRRNGMVVDLGKADGILLPDDMIPRENYRVGDRIKAYLYDVRKEPNGVFILLSRTHPEFLAKLFAQEVPEIYDGHIEIKAVARDPGSRAKVAILSREGRNARSFDPVGACVGVRGSRVNAITQEIAGERIDIILWSSDLPIFVVNALTPAEVTKVIMNDSRKSLTVVVEDSQQSIAIGRRGQNVRLAHELTGADIKIVTESFDAERRQKESQDSIAIFVEKLDLDDMMSRFLVAEGFHTIQDILDTPLEELSSMQGFTPEIAEELHQRAQESIAAMQEDAKKDFLAKGGESQLLDMIKNNEWIPLLEKHAIFTLSDIADLSLEELKDILSSEQGDSVSEKDLGHIIMEARRVKMGASME